MERPVESVLGLATEEMQKIRAATATFMEQWPLLLMPVDSEPAFLYDEPWRPRADIEACCRAVTLLRLPSVVVPGGTSVEGLPIGVQLVGRPHHEDEVLTAAAVIETAMGQWRPASKV